MIDINTIQELLVTMSWLTPIIIGLTGIVRVTLDLDERQSDRWLPLTSLFFGILGSITFVGLSLIGVAVGLVIGLSASGLYDVGKKSVLGISKGQKS